MTESSFKYIQEASEKISELNSEHVSSENYDKLRFQVYHCKSGIVIFAWRDHLTLHL